MKLIKLIKKNLKLFKRDRRTLVLITIAPVLILLILGNVFGQTTSSKSITGLKLGLCDLDKEDNEILLPFSEIENLGENCSDAAREKVAKGKIRASLIIPEDFSNNIREGYGSELIFYVDNSKTQTAIMATDAIKALVQDLNEKIGVEFIQNAWNRLNELNTNLKIIVEHLTLIKEQTNELQGKINELNNKINEIDTEELENKIYDINNTLSNYPLSNITITSNITEEIVILETFYDNNCPGTLTIEQCSTINSTINNLKEINSILVQKEAEINSILSSLNITTISEQTELIIETKENITEELKLLNQTVFDYSNNLIILIDELNETTQLLDIYTSREPKNIVRAITLNEEKVFGEKTYFDFLAPGLILVLLLFTILLVSSSNIVYERKIGTLARTLLSPTTIPMFLLAKTIFFFIISTIEIVVMLLTIKLFGITISTNSTVLLILFLTSLNFIFIGLMLGGFSSSENTALLSSLVIALPMLFLSGLFFPFEIMPKFMKSIGTNLPLTLGVESLDKIITYSSNIENIVILKIIVITFILSLFAYLAIKKKPTPD